MKTTNCKIGSGTRFYRWLIRNNFPDGCQVLCHNRNLAKGFYGECPHNQKKGVTMQPSLQQLQEYRTAFVEVWQDRLEPKGKELEARIYAPVGSPLAGISFDLKRLGTARDVEPLTDDIEWNRLFRRLVKALPEQGSQRVYLDRVVKVLAGTSMFIVKRSEQRLWTKSHARGDAHELLTEVFKAEWQRERSYHETED